jgi:hypothetical protein
MIDERWPTLTRELDTGLAWSSRVLRLRVNASAALRQPPRALVEFCGPSRMRARGSRAPMGCALPARRSPPSRPSTYAPSSSRSWRRPSLNFQSPSELNHRDPVPSPPVTRLGWTTLPLVDSFCPTAHAGLMDPFAGGGSLRRRVPRPGFGYPLRGLLHLASRCV